MLDFDPMSPTGLSRSFPKQNAMVISPLNRNLLYTKSEVNALIAGVSGAGVPAINRSINVINTNANAGSAALTDYIYLVSGATTITLPTAVNNTNRYTIKNQGSNTVIIATTSSQTIDGSNSASLTPNTSLDIISDGTNWRVI